MGFKLPNKFVLVAVVVVAVAMVMQIVAVAATGWSTSKDGSMDLGLWKVCVKTVCKDLSIVEDHMKAVRAFSLIGLLVLVGCVVVGALLFFLDNKLLPMLAAALAFVAAVCILIGFAVYAGEGDSTKADLSYCFALSVVSFVLSAAAGVLFLLPKFVG